MLVYNWSIDLKNKGGEDGLAESVGTISRMILSEAEAAAINYAEATARKIIRGAHVKGRGFEGALRKQFSGSIFVRDAMMTLFLEESEEGLIQTLETIFAFQKKHNGALPLRIEWVYHKARQFSRLFSFRRLWPVGVYDYNRLATSSRDTATLVAIACGKLFKRGEKGRALVKKHWQGLVSAMAREDEFIDPADGLMIGFDAPDWYDCVRREGKLTLINVLLYQAYREMAWMAKRLGYPEESERYRNRSIRLLDSILLTFWDEENGYFWAGETDDHFDTSANLAAILILPDLHHTVRAQKSIWEQMEGPAGMIPDFDKPYPREQLSSWMRWWRVEKYADIACYPWMTALGCLAELRIAEDHCDPTISREHLDRAVERFVLLSKLCVRDGTFHETHDPETSTLRPLKISRFGIPFYCSNPDFLAGASLYLAVYKKLERLGVFLCASPCAA